ncbi:putative ras-like G protein RagC [Serendipita vermifera]|nr:putative ras-like G protein RagC [Serendipita vermifera]
MVSQTPQPVPQDGVKGNGIVNEDASRQRILITGLRRSGKTSCKQVVFKGTQPKDTFFLQRTQEIEKSKFDSILPLELWDTPGREDISDNDMLELLQAVHAVVFVLDVNDHWYNAIAYFGDLVSTATDLKAFHLVFHVFVHKIETLANENKMTKFTELQKRINEELDDINIQSSPLARTLTFHATSIYDHTIYEAFSNVVTRLIPMDTLGQYENLLNSLHLSCGTKYAFLFDSVSCLRVSANQETHELPTFSLSVEYLKLLASMSQVIGSGLRDGDPGESYSCQLILSESTIAYWQITKNLCLILGMTSQNWKDLRGTIEYNVLQYRETLRKILELIEEFRNDGVLLNN